MAQSPLHVVCPHCGAINRLAESRLGEAPKCGSCHKGLFDGVPVAVDAAGFERHIMRNDIPVVVDFWRPGAAPATPMAPALERAAGALEPRQPHPQARHRARAGGRGALRPFGASRP